MAGYDEVVERVARAIAEIEGEQDDMPDDWRIYAKAAIAALQPGDELPNGHIWILPMEARDIAHRAREEMREACLAEKPGMAPRELSEQHVEPDAYMYGWDEGIDRWEESIRALPTDPPADEGGEWSDKRDVES